MKTLLSGIIGAAVATGGWLSLEHITQNDYGWLAILVGLITGVAMHLAAGAHAPESFVRGTLAALLALGACVGGRMLYVEYMQRVSAGPIAKVVQDDQPVAEEEADADSTEDQGEIAEEPERLDLGRELSDMPIKMEKPSLKKSMSEWDMLWLCVSALVAYVTGKGTDRVPATAEQPPAEPDESASEGGEGGEA